MYWDIANIVQLGSNSDQCYIQNRVVMKMCYKEVQNEVYTISM